MQKNNLKERAEATIDLANNNPFFYTMSPPLLTALLKSFRLLEKGNPELLKNAGYYEFGLFKGFSFWYAGQMSSIFADSKTFHHYGFDSFEGIGATEVDKANPFWRKGAYASPKNFVEGQLKRYGMSDNTQLFKGFYSEELFSDIDLMNDLLPCSIATIDCDIYEGAVLCLDFLRTKLRKGSIILFDDFDSLILGSTDKHGERRAWKEFQMKYPNIKSKPLFRFHKGAAFQITEI
ncbi:MAG: class I SAM-dependent methyltransferase [Alphaproteobacteria bacterium]